MTEPVFQITKAATFDAAHSLPAGPQERPYARLHGHSFRVEATLAGPARPPVGWVADLADLDQALGTIAAELDHSHLNDHAGLESPTLEALCLYFAGSPEARLSVAQADRRVPANGWRNLRDGGFLIRRWR